MRAGHGDVPGALPATGTAVGLGVCDVGGVRLPAGSGAGSPAVAGLTAFHAAHGGPYGDFHAGNVLLGADRAVYLIDPAPANPAFFTWPAEATPPPLAVDLAYWTFSAAVRAPRHPRTAAAALRLAGALRDAAVHPAGGRRLAAEIDRCLADYWVRLARQGLRQHAVAALARRLRPADGRPDRGGEDDRGRR